MIAEHLIFISFIALTMFLVFPSSRESLKENLLSFSLQEKLPDDSSPLYSLMKTGQELIIFDSLALAMIYICSLFVFYFYSLCITEFQQSLTTKFFVPLFIVLFVFNGVSFITYQFSQKENVENWHQTEVIPFISNLEEKNAEHIHTTILKEDKRRSLFYVETVYKEKNTLHTYTGWAKIQHEKENEVFSYRKLDYNLGFGIDKGLYNAVVSSDGLHYDYDSKTPDSAEPILKTTHLFVAILFSFMFMYGFFLTFMTINRIRGIYFPEESERENSSFVSSVVIENKIDNAEEDVVYSLKDKEIENNQEFPRRKIRI